MITIDYVPIQNILDAARQVVNGAAIDVLTNALNDADIQAKSDASDERAKRAIAYANEEIADDETEIPELPLISLGDDGIWIQSWSWVAFDEEENS